MLKIYLSDPGMKHKIVETEGFETLPAVLAEECNYTTAVIMDATSNEAVAYGDRDVGSMLWFVRLSSIKLKRKPCAKRVPTTTKS